MLSGVTEKVTVFSVDRTYAVNYTPLAEILNISSGAERRQNVMITESL
jgi:hypothetical protein